ncbi:MAG: hypothetical protein CMK59_05865 [Proteobacteria bacterium]|nr:hypothetical protein [Pseudomonadota bacterium]
MRGCFVFLVLIFALSFIVVTIKKHPDTLGYSTVPKSTSSAPSQSTKSPTVPVPVPNTPKAQPVDTNKPHDGLARMYNVTAFQRNSRSNSDIKIIRKRADNLCSEKSVQQVQVEKNGTVQDLSLEELDWVQLQGIILMLNFGHSGLEADLIVTEKQGGQYLISVYWEPNNTLVVSEKSPWTPPKIQNTSKEILKKTYKLSSIDDVDTSWTEDELGVVKHSLSVLSDDELALLADTQLLRQKKSDNKIKHGDWTQAGLFSQRDDKQIITLFNYMFAHEDLNFIGSIDAPHLNSTFTLLHEIGHLIHSYPSTLYIRVQNQKVNDANQLVSSYNAQPNQQKKEELLKRQEEIRIINGQQPNDEGPVLAEFRMNRMFQQGPTKYANVSISEAFAESFALYKLDPTALKRIDPKVFDWFSSNGHIQVINDLPYAQ